MGDTVKEIIMDMPAEEGGTRKRRRRGRRRTKVADGEEGVSVEKDQTVLAAPLQSQQPQPSQQQHTVVKRLQKPAPAPAPTVAIKPLVILAPPQKKPAKLVLVPKGVSKGVPKSVAKTFKARRVSVTIDNTAKTQKRRRQTIQRVEVMTPEQLRAAAVTAKLSRKETVEKVPVELLRQMLKDYYTMRGMLL